MTSRIHDIVVSCQLESAVIKYVNSTDSYGTFSDVLITKHYHEGSNFELRRFKIEGYLNLRTGILKFNLRCITNSISRLQFKFLL